MFHSIFYQLSSYEAALPPLKNAIQMLIMACVSTHSNTKLTYTSKDAIVYTLLFLLGILREAEKYNLQQREAVYAHVEFLFTDSG